MEVDTGILNRILDLYGVTSAGDSQYPVISEVGSLPRLRREALKTIVHNPGISIYDLAKVLQRDYSRVLKEIRLLAEMGEIEIRSDPKSSRKAKQLLPIRSINVPLKAASAGPASAL